jgi:hypothetical protein
LRLSAQGAYEFADIADTQHRLFICPGHIRKDTF